MTTENTQKVVVAIDLGAKYTGLFMVNHPAGETATRESASAMTLVVPNDGEGAKYSTTERTMTRHRLRNQKRFKLARRLLLLIVRSQIKRELTRAETESLCGLLKRRGFSRVETEVDMSSLKKVDPKPFAVFLGEPLNDTENLADQWGELSQDLGRTRALKDVMGRNDRKDFKKFVKREFGDSSEDYGDAYEALKLACDQVVNIESLGHKHRSRYLDAIRQDMEHDNRLSERLRQINASFGGIDRLWRLIGNISNLQLRALRWYFNDKKMAKSDYWDPERLQKVMVRSFRGFREDEKHPKDELKKITLAAEKADNFLGFLCEQDPNETIPPYENQNNRRPPVDQTLFLSPDGLDKFEEDLDESKRARSQNDAGDRAWKTWARNLSKKDSKLEEDLDVILEKVDRKSRLKGNRPVEDYKLSYILQRALDRNKTRDDYRLRLISAETTPNKGMNDSQVVHKARERLSEDLGAQHVPGFLAMARAYYQEVDQAKNSQWFKRDRSLLERSDLHPKAKANVLFILIGGVLGKDEKIGQQIKEKLWNATVKGTRKKLKSICGDIEKERKEYGNFFKVKMEEALRLEGALRSRKTTGSEDKDLLSLLKLHDNAVAAGEFLTAELGLKECERASDPYSLAQLYTLIETDRHGFASTTIAAFLENQWRMTNDGKKDEGAQCSRLPADAVRPFDGMLRKVLDRQAWEIARQVAASTKDKASLVGGKVDLTVLIEENNFAFTAALKTIKGKFDKKAQASFKKAATRFKSEFKDKKQRIKDASQGICAYTGNLLDNEHGEIDHIIARAGTIKNFGTIFNSEVNLIWVSQKGNQAKGDEIKRLWDLHPSYLERQFANLKELFKTANITEIIERVVKAFPTGWTFDQLTKDQMSCARHSLFLEDDSEAKKIVLEAIVATNRSRVNGTQAWLAKNIIQKIRKELDGWRISTGNSLEAHVWRINNMDVHSLREALGKEDNIYNKPDEQPVASHSIDAMCVYAVACKNDKIRKFMGADEELGRIDTTEKNTSEKKPAAHGINPGIEKLKTLYPFKCEIIPLERKSGLDKLDRSSRIIFKETIQGERFLHILLSDSEVYIGFSLEPGLDDCPQSVMVEGSEPMALVRQLDPYLKNHPKPGCKASQKLFIDRQKALALLSSAARGGILTPDESRAAELLHSLRYLQVRKPISSYLLNKGKLISDTNWTKEKKKFFVEINGSSEKFLPDNQKAYSFKGKIQMPVVSQWDAIYSYLNTSGESDLGQALEKHLGEQRKSETGLRHAKKRRVWSLPVPGDASGLYRIARKSFQGTNVYQAYNLSGKDTPAITRFRTVEGKVDWKSPLLRDFLNEGNVFPCKFDSVGKKVDESSIGMLEWREVYVNEQAGIRICLCPATEHRRRVRLEIPEKLALELCLTPQDATDNESLPIDSVDSDTGEVTRFGKSVISFRSELKATEDWVKVLEKFEIEHDCENLVKILGVPRGNLKVKSLGQKVVVDYTREGPCNANKAYNDSLA